MKKTFDKAVGRRLKEVREKLGLTLGEVSERMKFKNYQTLSAIEDGTRQIKALELAELAKIYFRDISYFLDITQHKEVQEVVVWRSRSDNNKYKVKEQEFIKYCHNYYDLEKRLGVDHRCTLNYPSSLNINDFNFQTAEMLASRCYMEMGLGSRPAYVLKKILEERYNIKILYLDLERYGSAASVMGDFGTAVLINASEAPWRRNYDLAHELFHIITWDIFNYKDIHSTGTSKSHVEKWAEAFASNLLLPADIVLEECTNRVKDGKISLLDIIGVAREFMVSTEALFWRLVGLGRLQKQDANKFKISEERRALDKKERQGDWGKIPNISDKYINLAYIAYQKGLISKGKLAEYLGVDRAEVSNYLLKLGYDEEGVYDREFVIT